jgi:hypothetical protein
MLVVTRGSFDARKKSDEREKQQKGDLALQAPSEPDLKASS